MWAAHYQFITVVIIFFSWRIVSILIMAERTVVRAKLINCCLTDNLPVTPPLGFPWHVLWKRGWDRNSIEIWTLPEQNKGNSKIW